MKVVLGFLGLLIGALIGLFGLFLILYRGEEGSEGDVYMNFGGSRIDSDFVGVPLLAVGLTLLAVSLLALRRSRIP
jgi:ABC-type lipoprotein release transport system permease subunit